MFFARRRFCELPAGERLQSVEEIAERKEET
jgi:hypothetical protein